ENKYGNVPLISQCFIYGESSDVFIIGIFVLEEDKLKEVLRGIGVEYTDDKDKMKTILNSMDVRKKVLSVIQNGIRMMNVPGYEVVKNCYFETEPFSAENDLLTPSFKLKRTQAKKKYIEITKILRAEVNKGII
ncbi:long-chain-fatty-acid-CoA ligase, putative, partial [Entamoeba invadens IP1]